MKTFLVAHDLTAFGDAAAEAALPLADSVDAEIVLFHVHAPEVVPPGQQNGEHTFQILKEVNAQLEEKAQEMRQRAPRLLIRCASSVGEPAEKVIEEAGRVGADYIITGTHGRGGLKRMVLGSVAENVIRGADCPVVVAKAPAE